LTSLTVDQRFEEAMCETWWLPEHTRVVSRPDVDYTSSSHTSRLFNAVMRVRESQGGYVSLVDEVMEVHRDRHSEWRLGAPSLHAPLETELANAGYVLRSEADAWTLSVDAPRPARPDGIDVTRIEDLDGLRDMFAVIDEAFGRDTERTDADLHEALAHSVGPNARCRRYVAYDSAGGEPLGAGSLNLFPQQGLGFLWGGSTRVSVRGRGVYSALTTTRLEVAKQLGLGEIGLFAVRSTSGPIVEKQGFTKHGPCRFWEHQMGSV